MVKRFDEAKFISSLPVALQEHLAKTHKDNVGKTKLDEAVKAFREYQESGRDASRTAKAIIDFLLSWKMGRYQNITKGSVSLLSKNLEPMRQKLLILGYNPRLETTELQHNEKRELIKDLFTQVSTSLNRRKVQYTCAAKVLFVFEPHLFPLWDGGIRESLGCSNNAEGYLNFMWRMQGLLRNKDVQKTLRGQRYKLRALDACLWNGYSTSKTR